MKRLPLQPGEWIDRTKPLQARFEGQAFAGYAGDTITSALLAGGTTMLGRSFKYHRPRGVLSVANHDANTLMQVRGRWYLKLRPSIVAPLASKALVIVSPA